MSSCIVNTCKDSTVGKGYCSFHYQRNQKGIKLDLPRYYRHGLSSSAEYKIWYSMKRRCYEKKNRYYHNYGGRGIKVCERWKDFNNFYRDMGKKPSKRHSIDRINNDGNYEPSNVRWATINQQAVNKSNTSEHPGVTYDKFRKKWVAILKVDKKYVLRKRYNNLDDAISARKNAEKEFL